MKRLFRRVVPVLVALALVFSLVACGTTGATGSSSTAGTGSTAVKKIGIIQILEHPSLDTIRQSIITELAAKGYKDGQNIKIDYENAQGDQSNLKSIAQKFVDNKYDLIIAIATPSAQAVVAETQDIPIVFSAATDPVGSGLVSNMQKPGGNVTGTSDAVSAAKIMELAQRITPNIKTIGALYNSGETNSVSVIKNLKEYAQQNQIKVIDATVTNTSEVQQAVTSLVGRVDAIFSPIDNTVASAMPVVAQAAIKAKLPVYVGADSMVKDGGLATYGINYSVLGKVTADMVVEILKGAKPGDIPVKTMSDMNIYVNKETARDIGVKLPDDVLKQAAQVFGN